MHDVGTVERSLSHLPARQGGILQSMDVPAFRCELLLWLVTDQQAFIAIENKHFQRMLLAVNIAVKPYIVECGDTIRNWIQDEFIKATAQITGYLACAVSKIHISFDLWSSSNGYALCGIVAHFVDESYRVQHCLIGLQRMRGSHTGLAIAEVIIPVLLRYEIQDNLGVFVSDNDASNC